MKYQKILLGWISLFCISAAAEVSTYQGSSRWSTTFFRPQATTSVGATSYTTFYLIESIDGSITGQVKIDAWLAKNPTTGRTERWYYVDRNFEIEYGFFGRFGADVGGGMQVDGIEAVMPFRGIYKSGFLNSFNLYPVADYYKPSSGLDVTQITGSARLNRSFSGDLLLVEAENDVLDYLEARGYAEAQ
ncbi:MAG: hypothetical protein RLZZ553_609 [Verrucomicrobiota bacterium]|jgi:hypothetical protein